MKNVYVGQLVKYSGTLEKKHGVYRVARIRVRTPNAFSGESGGLVYDLYTLSGRPALDGVRRFNIKTLKEGK